MFWMKERKMVQMPSPGDIEEINLLLALTNYFNQTTTHHERCKVDNRLSLQVVILCVWRDTVSTVSMRDHN
ncbi:hypothetical protein BLOT_003017 [Blomia tropicalis]|nr:hypothetical protein BLOT_003017 [Blomia tropicalis]